MSERTPRQEAQARFWDITERLAVATAEATKAGRRALAAADAKVHLGGDPNALADLAADYAGKVATLHAVEDEWRAFRAEHAGEMFETHRPIIATTLAKRLARRAKLNGERP